MPRPFARHAAALLLGAAVVLAACSPAAPSTAAPVASAPAGAVQPLPAEVSIGDARRLRAEGAFVLDVRQPEEWAAVHIPDATLIPLGELQARLAEVPRDRRVVVVCRSGNRSAQGRDALLAAGFPAVTSMAGGMNEWAAAGYETATGS
jgi:rhodanese-related sulfurtransferase